MKLYAISCEVLARATYYAAAMSPHIVDVELLDKGLHNEPDKLREHIQGRIDEVSKGEYDAIILGYGLCSNSIVGVTSTKRMVVPRAHDCITLFLGSRERYGQEFRDRPGTFWYAADYIERGGEGGGQSALGSSDDKSLAQTYEEYVEKYGRDNADYLMGIMGAWKEHYDRAAYIINQDIPMPDYRAKVREEASNRGWEFQELGGTMIIVRDLLFGNWDQERFQIVEPGYKITATHDAAVIGVVAAADA